MCILKQQQVLFPLGQLIVSPNALSLLGTEEIQRIASRHSLGDCPSLSQDEEELNRLAIACGGYVRSKYSYPAIQAEVVVLTTPLRRATRILLIEEE